MNIKLIIPTVAALALAAGTASAQDRNGAAAGRDGAAAGASSQAQTDRNRGDDRRTKRRGKGQDDRQGRQGRQANEASTYGSGAVYTSRRNSSAAVTSGGRARGTGSQSAGSTVDAYGETTRDGSSADVYGDSVANSSDPRN